MAKYTIDLFVENNVAKGNITFDPKSKTKKVINVQDLSETSTNYGETTFIAREDGGDGILVVTKRVSDKNIDYFFSGSYFSDDDFNFNFKKFNKKNAVG